MRNKFMAALGLLLVLVAPTFVASPAQAGTGAGDIIAVRADGVIDCTPGGASWPDWTYVGMRGAGKLCGNPNVSPPSPVRTWDRASDGKCVSIWFRINQGATIYKITPTEACGIGVIKAGWTPSYSVWDVYVGVHPQGATAWSQVTEWVQLY